MFWSSEPDEEEEALLCSPALMARRASESWIVAPPVEAMPVAAMSLQRKKSLPDVTQPIQLAATAPLSREEASVLSSMRREEVRKQIYEHERLKANPLLYLVSPQVKVSVQVPHGEKESAKEICVWHACERSERFTDPPIELHERERILFSFARHV
ncbi:hypothetical protein TSAR_014913 [Trichomalopsis sarcophagae]|uniref:Uncharacterized protein n=1 Tax=Trichomalopsis sarcophagae TaxID=543379 RepID=A0A232ELR6_9HYME|nr:hypothetical protein TSAR_014913 [Trichomalopsis sarcophagae]